jgi:hypothetical protein
MSDTSKPSPRRKTPAATAPRRKTASSAAAPNTTAKSRPKKKTAPSSTESPSTTETAKTAEDGGAENRGGTEAPPEAAGNAASVPRPARTARSQAGLVLWTVVSVAVLIGIIYATAPIWSPGLSAHLPAALRDPFQDPRMVGLDDRVQNLETQAKSVDAAGEAIRDLEDERSRFSGELKTMMERVGAVEEALASVRKMVEATSAPNESADAEIALRQLSERLARLEADGDGSSVDVDKLAAENARLSAAVAAISSRVGTVEEADRLPSSTASSGRAAVVAVGQLRESLRGSGPFVESLEAVKAMAGNDPGMAKAIAALEPHAVAGIATLAALRADFEDTASRIVGADSKHAGDSLFDRTLDRLSSLVRLRRTESGAGDGSSAVVARAEASLAGGDLVATVTTLESLDGAAAEAARPWLDRARHRLVAERALVTLHVLAIARVGSAGG